MGRFVLSCDEPHVCFIFTLFIWERACEDAPMANSSIPEDDKRKLTHPGQRTGEGTDSIVPFLRDELATKPADLGATDSQPKARKSLASRLRASLGKLKRK
jgi:hypothetical protein